MRPLEPRTIREPKETTVVRRVEPGFQKPIRLLVTPRLAGLYRSIHYPRRPRPPQASRPKSPPRFRNPQASIRR